MKNVSIELKWTAYFALISITWNLLERLAGFHTIRIADQQVVNMFILIPVTFLYTLALRDKQKNFYAGRMTYEQGLGCGLVLSALVSLLSPGYGAVNLLLVSPDYFQNAIRHAVSSGQMTSEQAEQQLNFATYAAAGIPAGIVTGLSITAIVMVFIRSKPSYETM